ncbi:MAG: DNA repair protein RecO [Peptococcaceae bacterium]|jgi:DNA repair protein RecO (recombination protein O)|nr:DNA repair protein RecO [Peptococcaceae bacterium]
MSDDHKLYHADAIVIRSREFGESDRLITLFSRERGRIEAVAKGARKPKSRQRAGVQLFTYADYLIYRGRNLDTVNQVSPKESFPHLWANLEQTLSAAGMAELLEHATIVHQPQGELFTLTITCFYLLEQMSPSLLLAAYALRLTTVLGIIPVLDCCVVCGSRLEASLERYIFDVSAGGAVCLHCRSGSRHLSLRAGSLAFMRRLLISDLRQLDRLRCPAWMLQEILDTLQAFCEHTFEKPLKSWKIGNRMIAAKE